MKEGWNKPELVVLVRRMSDEVLGATCKSSGNDPNGVGAAGKCIDTETGNGCYDYGNQP